MTGYRKRDTLSPPEQDLFDRIPADKAAELTAALAEWFDSDDPLGPIFDQIIEALGVEPYMQRDQQIRQVMVSMKGSNVWEPKRLLAFIVRLVDVVKPIETSPPVNPEENQDG